VGAILFQHQCYKCLGCKTFDDVRFCDNKDMTGLSTDGGMAEYMLSDAENTVPLPDSIPFEQGAPLMCAGVSAQSSNKLPWISQ
jgi:D-arabinose 1-dehydrogenase-like Zn-dependent alcohol dehydrogenase